MVRTGVKLTEIQITPETTVCSNDDLLTEILLRLPAKSILRFKSVSKHWLSLLSHRHFTQLYDNRCISPGLFFRKSYVPFDVENPIPCPFRSLSFYPDSHGIRIVQSCNGLLLCCSDTRFYEFTCKYYVFNPTTKQFAVIPSVIGGRAVRNTISFMGLAFHPTDCVHYKIVCIYHTNEYQNPYRVLYRIQIYSSETGEWKISHESFSSYRHKMLAFEFEYGVYWNGALHWPSLEDEAFYFNLDIEQVQYFPLPGQDYYYKYVWESRGHLYLVNTGDVENELLVNVYEMLSDHSGWFVKYQVEFDELVAAYPEMISKCRFPILSLYEFEVIDVVRGEEEEDTFMVVRIPNKIIRYNVVDKSFMPISDLCGTMLYGEQVHRYIVSIGSL